jgi:hypothetical protein
MNLGTSPMYLEPVRSLEESAPVLTHTIHDLS